MPEKLPISKRIDELKEKMQVLKKKKEEEEEDEEQGMYTVAVKTMAVHISKLKEARMNGKEKAEPIYQEKKNEMVDIFEEVDNLAEAKNIISTFVADQSYRNKDIAPAMEEGLDKEILEMISELDNMTVN